MRMDGENSELRIENGGREVWERGGRAVGGYVGTKVCLAPG